MNPEDFGINREEIEEMFRESNETMNQNLGQIGSHFAQLMDAIENKNWAATILIADHLELTLRAINQVAKSQLIYQNLGDDNES